MIDKRGVIFLLLVGVVLGVMSLGAYDGRLYTMQEALNRMAGAGEDSSLYFYGGYALHGTYWHANFGHPMSHGCVNLPTAEAEWLFHWADVGTMVNIHY